MDDIYQEFIIELYKNPLNYGRLDDADMKAELSNTTCGDTVVIYIKTKDGLVADAKFSGKGCAISQASSSLFTGFLKGKTVDSLAKITKEDVLSLLKIDLSKNPSRMRCALLPFEAMKRALKG